MKIMKRKLNVRPLVVCAALAALSVSAFGQRIRVVVNGDPVTFSGVGPRSMNGRVLVPLRGVLEKLGAYVDYESSTQTVTATRGETDIQLRIGERTARVGGRNVELDVPAAIYRGSTMVPLRFMGQALGAAVDWDDANQTVNITTDGSGIGAGRRRNDEDDDDQPVRTSTIGIRSFTANRRGTLAAGSTVRFTLRGTAGGDAFVKIEGVAGEIDMEERTPGVYVASFTAPRATAIRPASVSATLRVGRNERSARLDRGIR